MKKLNVAIVGYGNLGRALEEVILEKNECNLVAIFSRRKVESLFKTRVFDLKDISDFKGKIDILFLALGSYSDIEKFAPKIAENFNIVDSFDTHAKLKNYISRLNEIAKKSKTVTLSAFGWDPGLMSLMRATFKALDGNSACQSFWGKGVSQGHSDAIRRVDGVKNAIQYTVPNKEVLNKCKRLFDFRPQIYEKHKRICFVAKEKNGVESKIVRDISSMPNYFLGYETEVNFESENDIKRRQKRLAHKGYVFKNFIVCSQKIKLQFSLSTTSNPHLTATLMTMGARAVKRLANEKRFGAYSILDIPIKYYCDEEKIFELL